MVAAARRGTAAEALGGPQGGAYRSPSVGMNGVVSAAHGLAATAGLRILMEGGNAVDAAVAVGAALGVVEPFMSGLGGGGGFMLFHEGTTGQVHGLDYIGLPPAAADPSAFSSIDAINRDVRSSTVPGTLGGWLMALERFGTMDRAAVFAPAIRLAEQGWPITAFAAKQLTDCSSALGQHASSRGEYLPQGRPPQIGEVVPRPNLARTYREVVEGAPRRSTVATWPDVSAEPSRRPAAGSARTISPSSRPGGSSRWRSSIADGRSRQCRRSRSGSSTWSA